MSAKTSPPPAPLIRSPAEFDHAGTERAILDSAVSPVHNPWASTTRGRCSPWGDGHLQADWAERAWHSSAHGMLLRRLKIFTLGTPTPVPGGVEIDECASCFARMLLAWRGQGPGGSRGCLSLYLIP